MKHLFGTDGIRGEAGTFPLDSTTVCKIGFSLARYLSNAIDATPVIVVGRDTRESGVWIEQAVIKGAVLAQAECHSAGVITTPGVAFITRRMDAHAGIVISASHNPYYDNGIKIFSPTGRKIEDAVEQLIESDILGDGDPGVCSNGDRLFSSRPASEGRLRQLYLDFLATEIGAGLSLNGLKLVLDCANGASSDLAPDLFRRLGADVIAVNCEPDGRNINLNCGSLHMDGLRQRVVTERADLGVAFDGDADRSLFVDGQGNFVDGDATMWVLANYLHEKSRLKQDTVVATVMSNVGLEIALNSRGLHLVRTDVGDKYVLEELIRRECSLGGEQSGHMILPELSLAGDGMITTLCLIRAMIEADKSLAELVEGFKQYPQVLVNIRVREKPAFGDLPEVPDIVRAVEEKLLGRGRLLLRYSGTESLARVMIEGEDQREIEEYAQAIADKITAAIGAENPS